MAFGLYEACYVGHEEFVRIILEKYGRETEPNTFLNKSPLMNYSLHAAVLTGNVNIVDMLCRMGACTEIRDTHFRDTSLHIATRSYILPVMDKLLQHGADINAANVLGDTPLHTATLLAASSDYEDQASQRGFTALCFLLQFGAAQRANREKDTPLDVACRAKKWTVINKLLEYSSLENAEENVRTVCWLLGRFHEYGSVVTHLLANMQSDHSRFILLARVLRFALNDGQNVRGVLIPVIRTMLHVDHHMLGGGLNALLHAAVAVKSEDVVTLILDEGGDVNSVCWDLTLLQAACREQGGQSPAVLRLLIERGANVNFQHKGSPLHIAILCRRTDCMQLLLDHGAEVNVKDTGNGWSPLHLAYFRNRLDHVQLLRVYGADESIQDNYGRRPYDFCFYDNRV